VEADEVEAAIIVASRRANSAMPCETPENTFDRSATTTGRTTTSGHAAVRPYAEREADDEDDDRVDERDQRPRTPHRDAKRAPGGTPRLHRVLAR
jgi:hypothetical protein